MVSTRPPISKPFCPISNPLVTVLSASVTISITVTFMFHSFFSSLARARYLSLFSFSFNFTPVVCRDGKLHYSAGSFFYFLFFIFYFIYFIFFFILLTIIKCGRLAEIRWSVYVWKSQRICMCLILPDAIRVGQILFIRTVKFQFLHNSQRIWLLSFHSLQVFHISV